MERKEDKEEVLEKGEEIRRFWKVGVDENLTMEERKRRWKMMELARREREGKESGDEQQRAESGGQEMDLD